MAEQICKEKKKDIYTLFSLQNKSAEKMLSQRPLLASILISVQEMYCLYVNWASNCSLCAAVSAFRILLVALPASALPF